MENNTEPLKKNTFIFKLNIFYLYIHIFALESKSMRN